MISQESIGSFNPFKMEAFRCPVCGANKFVELIPHGGVWCDECNAEFFVRATCDGYNKLAVDCNTNYVHNDYYKEDMPSRYGAVIWRSDERVIWMGFTKDRRMVTVDPIPY